VKRGREHERDAGVMRYGCGKERKYQQEENTSEFDDERRDEEREREREAKERR